MLVACQVRSKTESPCPRRAVVEIRGVAFCGPCARKQEAYFAIGELTQEETQNLLSKPLAEALERMRWGRAAGKGSIAAEMHHGPRRSTRPSVSRLRRDNQVVPAPGSHMSS
jgi:predicted Fe-S protein YdhL (DUF1289 family)